MQFAVLSINYIHTPIEIRDQVSFSDTMKMELVTSLRNKDIHQVVILSTCNRLEVYFMFQEDDEIHTLKTLLEKMFAIDISKYINVMLDIEALQYVFEVTSGLQSMVLGEDQILGQVKDAVAFARQLGCLDKTMEKIFREAITSSKRMKQELKISEHPISISYIGIQQLDRICGIKDKKILVLGSGKVAELAITYAYEYGAIQVWNCNRSIHHAKALLQKFPTMKIYEFSQRYEVLKQCDIVVSATSSPHLVLQNDGKHDIPKNIFMLDLATPRDIDPSFPNVCNIDSLQTIANEHRQKRGDKAMLGKAMLQKDVETLKLWLTNSAMDQTLQSVQEHIDTVVKDTYDILNSKLSLSERERFILKKTLQSSMHRLMKEPILQIKKVSIEEQDTYQQVIETLFEQQEKQGDTLCIFE